MKREQFLIGITDVRDGLFPSLRYALAQLKQMNDENDGEFRKSERVVEKAAGDLKVNPEDLYVALTNATYPRCDFNLVDGHGNMGFLPAGMRFSEMRVSNFYRQIIAEYNNVDFDTPLYTPLPLALSNGTLGGRNHETHIPSHNIGEVIDATIALIKEPDLETKDLLNYIKGPDLLVGGEIINSDRLCSIYEKGFGVIEIKTTPQTINDEFWDDVSAFCRWYNIKFKRCLFKEEQKLFIRYQAKLFDGKTVKYMSLKEILQNYIEYCKSTANGDICQKLEKLKKLSNERKTWVQN